MVKRKSQKTIRRQKVNLKSDFPLYLNANLVLSEGRKLVREQKSMKKKASSGKRKPLKLIKTGVLDILKDMGYSFVTSSLVRMEVMQNLVKMEGITSDSARKTYLNILDKHDILEITAVNKHIQLTAALFERVAITSLSLKDAFHILIADDLRMPLCTHDDDMQSSASDHTSKKKFYDHVYKPHELVKKIKPISLR